MMKPVMQTRDGQPDLQRDAPVVSTRQVVEECGYYETQRSVVPGRVYERQVRVPVEDPCGCRPHPRALFSCLHKKAWATVAVQAPPREVCQTVYVPRQVVENVSETRYVCGSGRASGSGAELHLCRRATRRAFRSRRATW
ncbi:MAG: hypothetical protein U0794_10730 [Isosphaeraceae bacterium]